MALFLNAFFVVVELVGGLMTNSVAILSDALHDFGDCLSLALAWALQRKARRRGDKIYSYGYKRFSLLGSVFLSGVLSVSSLFMLYEAVRRIANPQSVNAEGMLWLAVAGVVINGAAALRLKRGSSLNERAVFLHIMEDVLGWVAVLAGSVIMLVVDLPVIDPLMSVGIALWVLSNVYKNMRDTFKIFLQAIPDGVDLDELQHAIEGTEGVESIHDLHVWTLDGESHVMTLHVVTHSTDIAAIKQAIYAVGETFHIEHVTIEFESESECECCKYLDE